MITGSKQQQLTFDKGITNLPSDNLCSDNTLAEAVGMVYDNGEHHVIQNPAWDFSVSRDYKLVFVHNLPTTDKNYIFINSGTLYYRTGKTGNFTSLDITVPSTFSAQQIQAIGKTLIIATEEGLKYAVWTGYGDVEYNTFDSIPVQDVEFFLLGNNDYYIHRDFNTSVQLDNNFDITADSQTTYKDFVAGNYAKDKTAVAQKKAFCLPFFLRTAIQLYDGSYTHISEPILMLPFVSENVGVTYLGFDDHVLTSVHWDFYYRKLYCINRSEIINDLCRKIVVFATKGVELYDMTVEQYLGNTFTNSNDLSGIYRDSLNGKSTYHQAVENGALSALKTRTRDEIERDIKASSIFYKLCEIDLNGDKTAHDIGEYIDTHTLENLTTQERLEYDDYHSFCPLKPNLLFAYNMRLNIAGIERGFFDGFEFFMPYDNADKHNYIALVRIKTESGIRIIRKEYETEHIQGIWFYYPDSRAEWVTIWKQVGDDAWWRILDARLTEHQSLSGSFYFKGIPNGGTDEFVVSENPYDDTIPKDTEPIITYEHLYNTIATSEVNNPFLFLASGYIIVGNGTIKAMTSLTQALSQGQFGQYPLLVFTTEGIWALSIASTGYIGSIHPLSREVMIGNTLPIQTDGAVFFASAKGLMVINGAQVTCVSTQLSGKTSVFKDANNVELVGDLGNFADYIANAIIAYDYRDSLLWIFNNNTANPDRCYVYAIRSGTFSTFELDRQVARVVNDYPDYLLQNSEGAVYSLLDRDNINDDDEDGYSSTLISRPMKLENGLALKSIMQIKHVCSLNDNASMTFRMWASNNLKDWVELHSLRGTPWKYYRFGYEFSHLKATDTFDGSVLITQERRTNKLR